MPKNCTVYSILISCPNDVEDEIKIIKEVIDDFNKNLGEINDIKLEAKHWKSNAYPQSNGKPQELLNKQFVNDCDMAVAVFWTRFGTPTDKYGSGTEEEIEEMIKSSKQVFLYFSDKPISPSAIDKEQYSKVTNFRNKYKDKGIYWSYTTDDEFKKYFTNHLNLYFLKKVNSEIKNKSNLKIRGIFNNEPSNILYAKLFDGYKKDCLETDILELYKEINSIYINDIPQIKYVSNLLGVNVTIENEIKEIIIQHSKVNNINISDNFFVLGNLSKTIAISAFPEGPKYNLNGSEQQKNKYRAINKLYRYIMQNYEYNEYSNKLKDKYFIQCIVSNIGNTYDEDIDIKLKVPKDNICTIRDLPIPGEFTIENFNNVITERIYKQKMEVYADEYSYYKFTPKLPLYNDKFKENDNLMKDIFCYSYFTLENYDILRFNISYLKHNTNMNFPSKLIFKKVPEYIEYEIRTKNLPDVISEKIGIKILE